MFDFLKRLFKREEPETRTLAIAELKQFFNENSKEFTRDLNLKVKGMKGRISYGTEKARENLAKLKKAELRNPQITIRERQFMDGNRDAYIRAVNHFLESVEIGNSYDSIIKSCDDFNDKLMQFAKSTAKAYRILQEFFAHESREIALNIKEIDSLAKELKKLVKGKGLDKLRKLKDDIIEISKKREQKINFIRELKEKEAEKEENARLRENIAKLQKEIKESNEYAELLSLNELRKKSITELGNLKSNFEHSFAIINAALRKYARIAMKNISLLNDYIDEPVKTAMKDKELNILDLLDGVRRNIFSNSIELKDKKKDKILDEIARMDKMFFINFRNELKRAAEKIKSLDERIRQNNSKERFEILSQKLGAAQEDAVKTENCIAYAKKEAGKIELEDDKRELEKEIKDVFGVEIFIS